MGSLMLLDTASLYYRAFYGMPETVTAPDGHAKAPAAENHHDRHAKPQREEHRRHGSPCRRDDYGLDLQRDRASPALNRHQQIMPHADAPPGPSRQRPRSSSSYRL